MSSTALELVISYSKEWANIIFAVVGSIIAVLTYLRARETILQPVRTEVIKKQSDLLIEIIEFVNKHFSSHYEGYLDLVRLNTIRWVDMFGFKYEGDKSLHKYLDEIEAGGVFVEKQLVNTTVLEPFQTNINTNPISEFEKDIWYKRGKAGNYKIDQVFLTKHYSRLKSRLIKYCNDPLLPTSVREPLIKLIKEMDINICVHLRETIEELIEIFFTKGKGFKFSPEGIYNIFNRTSIDHYPAYNELRISIRKYLKIETMP